MLVSYYMFYIFPEVLNKVYTFKFEYFKILKNILFRFLTNVPNFYSIYAVFYHIQGD
jgi:hypothetical protein